MVPVIAKAMPSLGNHERDKGRRLMVRVWSGRLASCAGLGFAQAVIVNQGRPDLSESR